MCSLDKKATFLRLICEEVAEQFLPVLGHISEYHRKPLNVLCHYLVYFTDFGFYYYCRQNALPSGRAFCIMGFDQTVAMGGEN